MSTRSIRAIASLLALLPLAACESTKSANPLSPSVAGPIPGVQITAPKPLEPGQNWKLKADAQPLTFLIENASSSGVRPVTLALEISSDAEFRNTVFTKTGLAPGEGGRTTYRMADRLAAGRSYFWRVKAEDGANTSPYSGAVVFEVLEPSSLQAPGLVSPTNGQTVSANPPTLVFRRAGRSGPVGEVSYDVEVSANESFTAMVWGEQTGEHGDEIRATPGTALAVDTPFFWRIRARGDGVQSPWSATWVFRTPKVASAPPPPPSAPPPGGGGGGGSCASRDGNYIASCIADKYPWYRRAGVSASERRANTEFLRDRMIEAGLCGGLDLGWNLKRGGPEISVDFLVERRDGRTTGIDMAMAYDDTSQELQLGWMVSTLPFYKRYDRPFSCN